MEKSHFSLTWDKFHSSMCAGFSILQQNGELVDLTLAADGHFVKVHQIVLSIASSFIKNLIQSADCKHPVIFMNNVSYKTLCSILEYVYTGEVSVEEKNINSFFEAAKSLQITGLDEAFFISTNDESTPAQIADVRRISEPKTDNVSQISTINYDKTSQTQKALNSGANKKIVEDKQPPAVRNTPRKRKITSYPNFDVKKAFEGSSDNKRLPKKDFDAESDADENDMDSGDNAALDDMDSFSPAGEENDLVPVENKEFSKPITDFQYTVSNQGSLQMILNRFMYNLCSRGNSTARGPVRRWRCVQYRNRDCPASAVTDHNVVVKRTNLHNHPFHDKRILDKIQKKSRIFRNSSKGCASGCSRLTV